MMIIKKKKKKDKNHDLLETLEGLGGDKKKDFLISRVQQMDGLDEFLKKNEEKGFRVSIYKKKLENPVLFFIFPPLMKEREWGKLERESGMSCN